MMNKTINTNGQINTDYINRFNYIPNSRLKTSDGFAIFNEKVSNRNVVTSEDKVINNAELKRLQYENAILKEALKILSK